ncbi:DUF2484 family protein [uncultured Shimia sp.]|uniref:DUF2484 family protein n=1 Tax=uncultured Shimia sp. TaxID=573152 RepID=UPI00261DC839|nr:DUF2484 family protein [uncultured Shimia sp.]
MSLSITLALLWMLAANIRAMFPSKDYLWRFAYGMIAIGVPILIYLWWEHGIWLALVFFFAGAWMMRWPVLYTWRWIKARIGR